MVVLQFAVDDPKFDPAAVAPHSVCYTGTHDNDTTVGWFNGDTGDTRSAGERERTRENALRLSGGAAATIHLDMVRLAFSSPAQLAVVPMQDFLGLDSRARLNTPGTTADNWRWRLLPTQFTSEFRRGVARLVTACARGQ
jgi:4-alpha-glucanotransferase